VREAIRLSDFVVIPLLPSLPDVRSTQRFYQGAIQEIASRRTLLGTLVLNAMQRGVGLCLEAEAYLRDETELPVCEVVVHQYVAFRRAIGLGQTVVELEPKSRAAHDMQALFDAIMEGMKSE
jgi:cellulose biosynthesis protein BcsQ